MEVGDAGGVGRGVGVCLGTLPAHPAIANAVINSATISGILAARLLTQSRFARIKMAALRNFLIPAVVMLLRLYRERFPV